MDREGEGGGEREREREREREDSKWTVHFLFCIISLFLS